ncbi:VanW family protein [uncultured Dysosmobacter sp.]|uniref:VanW family protein n=1 Tax=uncultured Dysosmobacter sp. TaxID=2591384 RepID=UPI0026126133|nr:VanW family protein [uncultured Dysosmobacter sp.]
MEQTTNEAIVQKKGGSRLQKEDAAKHHRKKWGLLIVGLFGVVCLAVYIGLGAYALHLDRFWPGTSVLGHDVSGLTVTEATQMLQEALPETDLFIYYMPEDSADNEFLSNPEDPDEEGAPPHYSVLLSDLGMELDAQALAQSAFDSQRNTSLLSAGKDYLRHRRTIRSSNYYAGNMLTLDEAKADAAAEAAAQALSIAPQDTSYTVAEDSIRFQVAKDGLQIDAAALKTAIREMEWLSDLSLKASYTAVPGRSLTAQEIYDEVSSEVKNAGYDAATDSIIPEQVGAEFDVAAAQAALDAAQPGETVEVPAVIEYPSVTAEQLKAVLFRDVLGEARTKVGGTAARKSNVKLSASTINDYVMNTGDVFSYNGVVGKRTAANGYKPAPAYVKGETVDEIGGGICQTSSTLYLACLRGNLEITERHAHRYIPSYIDAGMDATVSWGGPDYKFTNNTGYPIKIVTSYENGYLTVKLLGTNVTGVTAKMTHERLSTTNFEVVYEDDPTLAPGVEKVKTTPYTGSKWRTYRHLYDKDGNLISSAYEDTSDYKARNRVILRAPAQAAEPSAPVIGPGDIPASPDEPAVPVQPDEPVEETPSTPIIVLPEDFSNSAA